jgi:hypothetical protein
VRKIARFSAVLSVMADGVIGMRTKMDKLKEYFKERSMQMEFIFVLAKLGIQCPAFWGADYFEDEE